ncbi:MAG: hypothetical protein J0G99_10715 [Alphaproteobacteria bacterium]|nr:hypothetical protein [Alphaproteobacteria bacterium]
MDGIDLRIALVYAYAAHSNGRKADATRLTWRRCGEQSADTDTLIRTLV